MQPTASKSNLKAKKEPAAVSKKGSVSTADADAKLRQQLEAEAEKEISKVKRGADAKLKLKQKRIDQLEAAMEGRDEEMNKMHA